MAKEKVEFGSVFERLAPVLLVATIALSFAVGILWEKVKNLEGGGVQVAGTQTAPTNNGGTQPAPAPAGKLSEDVSSKVPAVSEADHIRGSRDADVVIVEYSDFECPFCKQFHPTMEQVMSEYGDRVAWVYRHYPLDVIHPRAKPSANASECVANLGGNDAFWKFADLLFGDQTKYLPDTGLREAAVAVGVDGAAYDSCYSAKQYDNVVTTQYQGGVDAGITGTPGSFVINKKGEKWLVPGAVPFDSLKATIEEALKS